jgi:hypothetical protein
VTQPEPSCPRCGAKQADWSLCRVCADKLRGQLLALPGLLRELHTTLTRQARMGSGGKSNERPLPYDVSASDVGDIVRATLSTWMRELGAEGLSDSPAAWCRWMADRVTWIGGQPYADEIADEIDHLTGLVRRAVDRPADREFCGKCETCGADLYARRGAVQETCGRCRAAGVETTYDPREARAEVLARVEHQWCTAAVCSTVLASFGIEVKAETVQNWARPRDDGKPAKLARRGENRLGHALFLVGDVMDLAREQRERRSGRRVAV